MKIGDLAKAVGVSAQTIRFYEREGLLPEAARDRNGYRDYADGAAERVMFIRRCAEVGFTLREIRPLLEIGEKSCGEVAGLLDAKIAGLARRMAEMKRLKHGLEVLRAQCARTERSRECGALRAIAPAER